jgi:hypothetical protein
MRSGLTVLMNMVLRLCGVAVQPMKGSKRSKRSKRVKPIAQLLIYPSTHSLHLNYGIITTAI